MAATSRGRRRTGAHRAAGALLAAAAAFAAPPAGAQAAAARPAVASINLCADQLVLTVADPEQILTVSWLAADPEESLLAEQAARYPLNYGSAEELLRYRPDVVVAGAYTGAFTRALLERLGYRVVELDPAVTVADIAANVRRVAEAVGRPDRGAALVAALQQRVRRLEAARPAAPVDTVIVRPGGFTVGRDSLAHELLTLAGLRNAAAEQGLDRWGSLSVEALLRSDPELLVMTGYRDDEPSLANAVLRHPALVAAARERAVVTVPAAYWSCGLPQSLDAVDLLRRGLP
ncbi:MAG TPA: ABC transporter substrate-binding protein [Gammaproteobacteria bacterium]